jgi:uncharacterized protein YcbK (DUF882 family)
MEYKYFKANEIISLDPELVYMLDSARDIAGVPFIISSGYRTKEKNSKVGGVEDSAHLTGKAADLRCTNSTQRYLMVDALISAGFKRIGFGIGHIHVDIDEEKPQNVLFIEHA